MTKHSNHLLVILILSLFLGNIPELKAQGFFKNLKNKAERTLNVNLNTRKNTKKDNPKSTDPNSSVKVPPKYHDPKCISGDCQNGYGKQDCDYGIYEGQFKNGKREGKGTFEYTKGDFTGNKYVGDFSDNSFNGYGKIVYPNSKWTKYYEGHFVDNEWDGKGAVMNWDGSILSGNYSKGRLSGVGATTKDRLTRLGYYSGDMPANFNHGLPLETVTKHQDTVFSKFKKCNCLSKKDFSIPSIGLANIKYDLISTYTGKKVGETSDLDYEMSTFDVSGLTNNTRHNIYIKCYRKQFFESRNTYEYIDDSYIVYPGQNIMANYRIQPQPGDTYDHYFNETFIFLGQYCDKEFADCKSKPKSANNFVLNVSGPEASYKKLIKKGSKVTISASGEIKVGIWAGYSTPNGIDGYEQYSKITGFRHGALLAKFGANGKWFVVGNNYTFTAKSDGNIRFTVNDADASNNSGSYEVEISVK